MADDWDKAVQHAVNGVFLFYRRFMDYHAHRFFDHSLVVREEGQIVALFPANEANGVIYSHQGLTYGGWVYCKRIGSCEIGHLFEIVEEYYKNLHFTEIHYKHKPFVFLSRIYDADAWMLWHKGYTMWRRDLGFVIDMQWNMGFAKDKHYRLNKSKRNHLRIESNGDIRQLMALVATNLRERFQISPTHSVEEALMLQNRFPENIHTICVFQDDLFLGGTWLFVDNHFIHTQYLHSNDEGKDLCAIEFLIDYLIERYKTTKRYLSFGTSTEFDGNVLNEGLASFKEGFGATGICHDFYKKQLS